MCGIVAYMGFQEALPILLRGLKRLEYRGHDSAGVGLIVEGSNSKSNIRIIKKKGKVASLESQCQNLEIPSKVGIAHTRWATHGAPSDLNAHPHVDVADSVAVVHNGIIENYVSIKKLLEQKGVKIRSETDTEVLAHLVYCVRMENPTMPLEEVVRLALQPVEGAYGVVFIFAEQPNLIIAARHGSPMLLGVGKGEYFLASDASAIIEHTRTVEYIGEDEIVSITPNGYVVSSLHMSPPGPRKQSLHHLEISLEAIEKGGYKHFMLKEIMEQPAVIMNAMRGRIDTSNNQIFLGGLNNGAMDDLKNCKRIIIVACGTSYHSGMVAKYALEDISRVSVTVELASEFRYRNPVLHPESDVLIAISQSGETADTLAALREAKKHGVKALGVVNVVGSSIARETEAGCYLHVGPEVGVASTKAFTGQVVVLLMIAFKLAYEKGSITEAEMQEYVAQLAVLPDKMQEILSTQTDKLQDIAKSHKFASSFLFLGRGYNYPVALEGALKLKEVSYIHAEGYAAAEMKHGPIALIDPLIPVVIIAPSNDPLYPKIMSNMEEILARGGNVIVITDKESEELSSKCEAVITIPSTISCLSPLLSVVPLQLLSYYIADMRKCDVDQPRNLAKSVTVE